MAGNSSGARRLPWKSASINAGKGAIAKALGAGTSTVQRVKERSFIL
jgi:hypothetical protein